MSKIAIVIGATGLVGSYLVQQLVQDPSYREVITFSRKPLGIRHPKLAQKPFPQGFIPPGELQGDDFFCCLGTTIKKAGSRNAFRYVDFEIPLMFAKAAKEAGVNHFLLVSAMGAHSESRIFYSRIKGDLENAIAKLGFPSFTIVRPWLLLGPRTEFRLGEKMGEAFQAVLNPLLIGRLKDFRSVHGSDVARCLVEAAQHPPMGTWVIPSGKIRRNSQHPNPA